ncbi:MAG: DNA cytosine methyltransferase [Firmicutes bacterium]|nr:DNA cytosine methyltransferase [Bacillota bacterium]
MIGKKYVEENGYYHTKEPIITPLGNVSDTKATVVELFCGCGGTSLGFEMAGYEILLGLDIHRPSIQTFKKNHENVATILGDVRKVTAQDIRKVINNRHINVLIGGVPCQGFSLNNKKRSGDDERNFLYKEFLRFAEELQPDVVVIENVSGMRSTSNGEFIKNISDDIRKCGDYEVNSQTLCAADYGVPQKRNRIVFVGIKNKVKFDFSDVIKTHGDGTGKKYNTVKDAIGDLPSLGNDHEIKTYDKEPFSDYQKLMRDNCTDLTNHKSPNHPPETIENIKMTEPGKPMYESFTQRIRLAWDMQSPTQVAGGIRPQFQFGHPIDNRGLSIRERCRLQSFPDTFEVCGGIVQGRVQTGNAVPPLLAKALALAIAKKMSWQEAADL